MRIDATSQGIARYAVYYGDVTHGRSRRSLG